MAGPTDPRFLRESGTELFNGNELLVKGALETSGGCHLLTGYPGSPVAQFFDIIESNADLFRNWGIHGAVANNEALSVAMVNGSQMAPLRSMAVFKSVGAHVASDSLALGNLAGTHPDGGGVIVVYGDDPWNETTQVPADSRWLSRHVRVPVLEPSDLQECKDWIDLGFRLSAASQLYIGYMYTTPQAEGGGSVECRPNHKPAINAVQRTGLSTAAIALEQRVLLPPRTGRMEATFPDRFRRLHRAARMLRVNRLLNEPPAGAGRVPLGFISSGMPWCYLEHALAELGLHGKIPVLKLGITYPLDAREIEQFAGMVENIVVVEDRRAFLEEQVADIALLWNQGGGADRPVRVWGKRFPFGLQGFPELWGLSPSLVIGRLMPLLERMLPRRASAGGSRHGADPASRERPGFPAFDPAKFREQSELLDLVGRGVIRLPEGPARSAIPLPILAPVGNDDSAAGATLPGASPSGQSGCGTSGCGTSSGTSSSGSSAEMPALPMRSPTFCPGCPHRDSSSVLLEVKKLFLDPAYMRHRHGRDPVDLVFHGDTGCYTMLMFEPNQALMHNYSGMGLGGATGAGIDPFITNKQVVFMGDSTFFHSGSVALSNSVKNRQDITYIILDNKTTAMTGHQPTPGVDADLLGRPTPVQDIARIARAVLPPASTVAVVNPENREEWKDLLERTILSTGVKVLIADKECGITWHRRRARDERRVEKTLGYLPRKTFINISADVCEECRICTTTTGCPGLKVEPTDYGPKVQTDLTTCVADGACFRAGGLACPSFEFVTVKRKAPAGERTDGLRLDNLPEPVLRPLGADGRSPTWRSYLAGVGGMGIGIANSILVHAGRRQGYRVLFSEKRGLAIRNGGVFSQVIYAAEGAITSAVVPQGRADLLFGVDLLEAARSLDPGGNARVGSPVHTGAVLNTYKTATITGLTGKEDFDPAALVAGIRGRVRAEGFFAEDVGALCQRMLGSTLYANIMMLGVAWQLGHVPVSLENIRTAVETVVRAEREKNLRAFQLGRKLVVDPEAFQLAPRRQSFAELVEEKAACFRKEYWFTGSRRASAFRRLVEEAVAPMRAKGVDDGLLRDFAVRIYDTQQFGGAGYARRYASLVRLVFDQDSDAMGLRATRAVVVNLAKAMLIKDEVYVAYLLTRVEKLEADRRRYDVDPARGDRIGYKHINKPEFNLFGLRVRLPFAIHSRNWMLRILRRCTILRRGRWAPFHHPEEEAFREWYVELVEGFRWADRAGYDTYVEALCVPEPVKGYREIRYPKMEEARRRAEALLAGIPDHPPDSAAPLVAPAAPGHAAGVVTGHGSGVAAGSTGTAGMVIGPTAGAAASAAPGSVDEDSAQSNHGLGEYGVGQYHGAVAGSPARSGRE